LAVGVARFKRQAMLKRHRIQRGTPLLRAENLNSLAEISAQELVIRGGGRALIRTSRERS